MVKTKNKKVIVAMSGGVDSSVAAKLLKNQGYEPMGIFLYFWKDENPPTPPSTSFPQLSSRQAGQALYQGGLAENKCCSLEALMDARRVCQKVGLPLYTLNFSDIFKKEVVDYFLDEYKRGNTPNPCIRCNKLVKLGLLIEQAKKLGFDYVASGHYARLRREIPNSKFPACQSLALAGRQIPNKIQNSKNNDGVVYKLFRAKDKDKDQSYFLYTLTQEQLKHLLFPLGNYRKEGVRRIAKKFRLPVATKKESQEICFIGDKAHNNFLRRHLKLKPGPIRQLNFPSKKDKNEISRAGSPEIGRHEGLPLYTIGQRKGVEIGGIGPFYVASCDYKTNTLYVVSDRDDRILYNDKLLAVNVNWTSGVAPIFPLKCEARVRYRQVAVKCRVTPASTLAVATKKKLYLVKFSQPIRAITPGQSVVFYKKDEVLGGGVIEAAGHL